MLKQISLIVKHRSENANRIADVLVKDLLKRGISVTKGRIDSEDEAVIVLGGDGTLLHVAGDAYCRKIPLLGINLGGLGFLTEIHMDEMQDSIDSLISGAFDLDRRTILSVTVRRPDSRDTEYYALNEAVVTKGPLGKIIDIPTWANDSFLTTYRGDGLIIATATGSTAYNLSAAGPILHPGLEALVLTPICPFALSARPLILPGEMEVVIRLKNASEEVSLIVDGQVGHQLKNGDILEIQKAEGYLKLIRSPLRDYFTILREKLGWTRGVGTDEL